MGQSNFYDPNKNPSAIQGISGSTAHLQKGEGLVREANRELTGGYGFAEKKPSCSDSGFAAATQQRLEASLMAFRAQQAPAPALEAH